MAKRKRTKEETKELNWKIAEIIWYSIGGIILLGGLTFSVMGVMIMNMNGNFKYHPFYGLYQSQSAFFKWLGFGSSYANLGVMLILISMLYFVIVFYIFARRADIKDKKTKQNKERVRNFKLILDTPTSGEVKDNSSENK